MNTLDRLDFSHEPVITVDDIISRVQAYHTDVDVELLKSAFEFAKCMSARRYDPMYDYNHFKGK